MVDKYIKILKTQLKKLEEDGFDFEAWKTATVIVLTRVFGPRDVKIGRLESIRVEYGSSWSMRAVSGSFDPINSAKKQGAEIVRVAIEELDLYGEEVISPCGELIESAISEVLKMSDYRKLQELMSADDQIVKKEELNKFLKKFTKDELVMVLTNILAEQ